MAYFKSAKDFELPYGRAWLLKLDADLLTWADADARKWVVNLAPLSDRFASDLLTYFNTLPFVTRAGIHQNTAFSMTLVLDYADTTKNASLRDAVNRAAHKFFAGDLNCPTDYEPSGPDFLSPCLEEAEAMSRILQPSEFTKWFNAFMPTPNSNKFRPLIEPFDSSLVVNEEQLASRSHLIGLAFDRAEAMLTLAHAFRPDDPRVEIYQRLAAINAAGGFKDLAGAGYLGSHWLGTAALRYELARDKR